MISIDYYDIPASEIERIIIIPLENQFAEIEGITEIISAAENSRGRIWVRTDDAESKNSVYLDIRAKTYALFDLLPPAVQKPEIYSSGMGEPPVFIASFSNKDISLSELSARIDRDIRTGFGKIQGTGRIEIGGIEPEEIMITINNDKMKKFGLAFSAIAEALNTECLLLPLGNKIAVSMNPASPEDIRDIFLRNQKGDALRLGEIAEITAERSKKRSIFRINGEEVPMIIVYPQSGANPVALSRELRKETDKWRNRGYEGEIVYDFGRMMKDDLSNLVKTVIWGISSSIAFLILFGREYLTVPLMVFPLTILILFGVYNLLGLTIDRFILWGISIGSGLIFDCGIILIHGRKHGASPGKLFPALFSSICTTLAALFPLYLLGGNTAGTKEIVLTISLLSVISFVVSILFLPPFFPQTAEHRICWTHYCRNAFSLLKRKKIIQFTIICLASGAVLSLFGLEIDSEEYQPRTSLEIQADFSGRVSLEKCDFYLQRAQEYLSGNKGIVSVQTRAKTGSGEMTLVFDPEIISSEEIGYFIQTLNNEIPEVFFYSPPFSSEKERFMTITVTGPSTEACRDYADTLCRELTEFPWITKGILNFKKPLPRLIYKVNSEKSLIKNISPGELGTAMRLYLFNPVITKWRAGSGEKDIRGRLSAGENFSPVNRNTFPLLEDTGLFSKENAPGRIIRKNRQYAASLTVHTENMTLGSFLYALESYIYSKAFPDGYSVVIEKEAYKTLEAVQNLIKALSAALIFIYMILAGEANSLSAPFLLIAVPLISITPPLVLLFCAKKPVTIVILAGFIILSGITINNGILIHSGFTELQISDKRIRAAKAVVQRFKPMILTTGTTVLGILPFLLNSSGQNYLSGIAFVLLTGLPCSLFASLIVLPVLLGSRE